MKLKQSLMNATVSLDRFRTGTGTTSTAMTRLMNAVNTGGTAVGRLRGTLTSVGGGLGTARTGTDRFTSSLGRLKGAADRTRQSLQDVKRQADAVENSVGKAGKNADRGGKSMSGLGSGLKGASLAQRGLNLAMAASPFGLIMTLLTPLIARFVSVDKVVAVAKKGFTAAWSAMRSSASAAARFLEPLFKGVVNAFLTPTRMLVRGLNALISGLNQVKFKVPDWVPVIGGKGFQFNLPRIPVPQLADGGIVEARSGGRLALIGEGGESEAVIPLSRLERMLGHHPGGGAALHRLAEAVERLAERPVQVEVDSQTIARAVLVGQRKLARR
ncbi:hypothetical protein ACFYYH_06510 [Streptomyces sp. NPDC002018]|uniref:hypothetical protein n=1 Tax=Streptomyces sp. NPDC002018 TaxID=3364629 RepID=UPI0036C91EB5